MRGYNGGVKQKTSDSPRTGGDGQVRLHKALATAGLASRRACEELIARGAVAVNGEAVVRSPVWVNPDLDKVTIDGRPVRLKSDRLVYVMLYKPRNTVTTLEDPDGRRTVGELVDHPSGERLYPVGRLDYDTMGLVLMTNDGELANRLTHPRYEVHKTYRAVVKGRLEDEMLEKLREGFYLADRRSGRTDGREQDGGRGDRGGAREPTRTLIDITLREGRNRQVRRMLAKVGCPVKKLVRIQMGPLTLKGVPLGAWRELTSTEVGLLKRAAGIGKGSTARSGRADEGRGGTGGAETHEVTPPSARTGRTRTQAHFRVPARSGPARRAAAGARPCSATGCGVVVPHGVQSDPGARAVADCAQGVLRRTRHPRTAGPRDGVSRVLGVVGECGGG